MSARFILEPLTKTHSREDFTCGNDRIDRYFREIVQQDIKRDYATCLVACENSETKRIVGFYTLSSNSIPLTGVPDILARKLPRYPTVPAVLIGWLARHRDYAGRKLGEALLFGAIKTVATAPIGAHAILADAIDDKIAAFYAAFGFASLNDGSNRFFLPLATARKQLVASKLIDD